MANIIYGANRITVAGEPFLLVGGDASHLGAEAQEKDGGRPAIEPWIWEMAEEWQASYSHEELKAPSWSPRTLCGYIWSNMKPGDGPIFSPWRTPAHAPNPTWYQLGEVARRLSRWPSLLDPVTPTRDNWFGQRQ